MFNDYARLRGRPPLNDDRINAQIKHAYDTALAVHPYRCIRELRFSEPRITLHPELEGLLAGLAKQGKPIENVRFLDVGACLMTDL